MRMRDKRGFTLIELIVAACIAGLMLAITVPGFIHFRSSMMRSQGRTCMTQSRSYAPNGPGPSGS